MILILSAGVFQTLDLVGRIVANLRLMLRRPERLQFAALCFRRSEVANDVEVLLITSRETRRWVIPKGWPMNGKSAPAVAEQEALEEAGVKGRALTLPAGSYLYLKRLQSGLKVPCEVQVYPLEVSGFVDSYKEKGQRKKEWVSADEAARRVAEPGLKELILSFATAMKRETRKTASG
jgi:8-oxo-dGTP pyrophosphatase MutT (NUDIX family)